MVRTVESLHTLDDQELSRARLVIDNAAFPVPEDGVSGYIRDTRHNRVRVRVIPVAALLATLLPKSELRRMGQLISSHRSPFRK